MSVSEEKAVWPGWETVRLIGRGSFGAVYEIERDVLGNKEKAALKVITIPQSSSDIDELYGEGYDDASITSTFQNYLKSIVAEYALMRKLNGSSNVVSCDDVRYVQHDDGFGWDIFIKMELLTPLNKALDKIVPEEQVVRIGTDICRALALCKKHNIIHRDIKPANIFVSENGDYKLGDFGIAKTVEKTSGGTKIGTYEYMAPEVYQDRPYGSSADIYSLGLVLYWLLNERRTPFLKLPPELPTNVEKEQARQRRFHGEPLPAPIHGSEALKRIVLKACAYDPAERYASAEEMLRDLDALSSDVPAAAAVPEPARLSPAAARNGRVRTEDEELTAGMFYAPAVPSAARINDQDATTGVRFAPTAASDPEATSRASFAPSVQQNQPRPAQIPIQTAKPVPQDLPSPVKSGQDRKSRKGLIIGAVGAFAVLAAVLLIVFLPKMTMPTAPVETVAEPTEETVTPRPTEPAASEPTATESQEEDSASFIVDSGSCGADLRWTMENTGVLTISGTGDMEDYPNPDDQPWVGFREDIIIVDLSDGITGIGENAFKFCENLTDIEIPDGITRIGSYAFGYCANLNAVRIPDGVVSIGEAAFMICANLTEISIPDSVVEIGESAFLFCDNLARIDVSDGNRSYASEDGVLFSCDKCILICYPADKEGRDYMIPESVIEVGGYAFAWCNHLVNVNIPSSVVKMSGSPFRYSRSLGRISVSAGNQAYAAVDGVLFSYDKSTLIGYPPGRADSEYAIPYGVTAIGKYAFAGSENLTSVSIPDTVTRLDSSAFIGCFGLTGVRLPNSVSYIGYQAFRQCINLNSVSIPASVTKIGSYAFEECERLTDVYYSGSAAQWAQINIDETGNDFLFSAGIHYNQ